ncbi:GNAT family N-acetyltransferase [Pontibacter diazotrophicus]|uniref:GNAT family N-acetyltransferase n=1 Tax=Pontibacter diazotrophicus TaxID=1400979 RepID=A0A3D8LFF9_9BACT|nr:GNAT family N-acetyltransferase [Pontibacter diazotrophicus]RDV16137.1 GNAT family N-acetyltransferase [Pontibacter diazotrophicus]
MEHIAKKRIEYTVRVANEQDLPAIIELFELSLGAEHGAPTESFWRWKHIDNPFGVSPVLLAFDGDKLVGLRAFMRWQWQYQGRILPAFRAVDTGTHPDYRGKGIFSRLTKQLVAELKESEPSCFIYNTPNDQSKPGYLKMGWQVLGKPNIIGSVALRYSSKARQRFDTYHQYLQQLDLNNLPASYRVDVKQDRIHVNHSLAYYKWRYQSIPELPYGAYRYETKEGEVLLFFHLKFRKYFYELRISDALWLSGNPKRQMLMSASHRLAGHLGTPFISLVSKDPITYWERVRYRMFSMKKFAPELTIREVNDKDLLALVSDINNWSFTMGDLELF